MKLTELLLNRFSEPIGYQLNTLNFSWIPLEMDGIVLTTLRIQVWKCKNQNKLIYDSGMMQYPGVHLYSIELKLEPRTEYFWEVSVWDQHGNLYAESSFFETGKLDELWNADWISVTDESSEVMPVIFKEFQIPFPIKSARLYIYGLGIYETVINMKEASDELLQPGYHSYDLNMSYQTIKVDNLLKTGINKIEIILGEGWYKGRFGFDGDYRNIYGDRKMCIAQLNVIGEHGETLEVVTDSTWEAKTSTICTNGIYDGEIIDATRESKKLDICVISQTKELLTERSNPRISRRATIQVCQIIQEEDGSIVYDFGKIITGWVELLADLKKDQTVELLYGEVLQGNRFYNDNLRTAEAKFIYTSNGTIENIRPHFTFFGFRYVKVSGVALDRIKSILAYEIYSELSETGYIRTSNEKVNQLYRNTKQSQKCNFLDIPTDCPQRDERMGWTGDVTIFAETACMHMDSEAFFQHYIENLGLEQKVLKGSIPFFVPMPKLAFHQNMNPFYMSSGAAVWGDVATVLPWTLYKTYGNKANLRKNYQVMLSWVQHLIEVTASNPIPFLWQNERQLGDWLALDNGDIHNPIGLTDQGMIASAYYYQSVKFTANAASVLDTPEINSLKNLEKNIKQAFIVEYYSKDGKLKVVETQTACAMLLNMKLYKPSSKDYLITTLKRLMDDNHGKLNTGFVGTAHLLQALSENGLNEYAYTLLLNEEYPGWLYEVNLGATTIWERWNSILEDGTISGTEMNSLNHYAYGCIAGWMYRYMLGFKPQFDQEIIMVIEPLPDKRINHVSGSWKSRYGEYHLEWEWNDNLIEYRIDIPYGANAEIRIGKDVRKVYNGGQYFFQQKLGDKTFAK